VLFQRIIGGFNVEEAVSLAGLIYSFHLYENAFGPGILNFSRITGILHGIPERLRHLKVLSICNY
jgi:hypothetical protein